jgi:hypothetical protein
LLRFGDDDVDNFLGFRVLNGGDGFHGRAPAVSYSIMKPYSEANLPATPETGGTFAW